MTWFPRRKAKVTQSSTSHGSTARSWTAPPDRAKRRRRWPRDPFATKAAEVGIGDLADTVASATDLDLRDSAVRASSRRSFDNEWGDLSERDQDQAEAAAFDEFWERAGGPGSLEERLVRILG